MFTCTMSLIWWIRYSWWDRGGRGKPLHLDT